MRDRISRVILGSISLLWFAVFAVVGVPLGYLAATWGDPESVTSRVAAKPAPAQDDKTAVNLIAQLDAPSR